MMIDADQIAQTPQLSNKLVWAKSRILELETQMGLSSGAVRQLDEELLRSNPEVIRIMAESAVKCSSFNNAVRGPDGQCIRNYVTDGGVYVPDIPLSGVSNDGSKES